MKWFNDYNITYYPVLFHMELLRKCILSVFLWLIPLLHSPHNAFPFFCCFVPFFSYFALSYPWNHLKHLLLYLTLNTIDAFQSRVRLSDSATAALMNSRGFVSSAMIKLPAAPFTLQRYCEILMNPEKFYAANASKLAYAFEKLLRVTGTTPDLTPAEFKRRLAELQQERQQLEQTTSKEPRGPIALDADFRPVTTMMGQMGLGGGLGGLGGLGGSVTAVKNPEIEDNWTTRVAESMQEQQQKSLMAEVGTEPAPAASGVGDNTNNSNNSNTSNDSNSGTSNAMDTSD